MSPHKIFDTISSSPITGIASAVIIACVTILIVNIADEDTNTHKPLYKHMNDTGINTDESDNQRVNFDYEETKTYTSNTSDGYKASEPSSHPYYNSASKDKAMADKVPYHPSSSGIPRTADTADSAVPENTVTIFSPGFSSQSAGKATGVDPEEGDSSDRVPDSTDPDIVYPITSEHSVQIDLDETQTISCRPVVENGPACMCTLTITDLTGTVVELMDNCG